MHSVGSPMQFAYFVQKSSQRAWPPDDVPFETLELPTSLVEVATSLVLPPAPPAPPEPPLPSEKMTLPPQAATSERDETRSARSIVVRMGISTEEKGLPH